MIVDFDKVSQALHSALSASFTEAFHDILDWAITIFLLVRQQLERGTACALKNLGLTGTGACLYHK